MTEKRKPKSKAAVKHRIKKAVSEERLTIFNHFDPGEKYNPIWWIASYPKSGSTWLRMFLTAYATHGRVDINAPGVVTSDQNPLFFQSSSIKPITLVNDCEIAHIRPAMLLNIINTYPRRPLYIKTHHIYATIDHIPLIPPTLTMGATYIIRDPRDIAVSYASHMGVSIDRSIEMMLDPSHRNGELPVLYVVSRWDEHVKSWADSATKDGMRVGVMKYEDLLLEPEKRFENILGHMGGPIIPAHIYYAVAASSFDSLRAQEEESGFKENTEHQEYFFRQGKAGAWKDVLSKKQVNLIEKEFGPTMERFGYGSI